MKEKKWRVGDRVEYRKADGAPGSSMLNGCRGTVVYIDGQEACCTVRFDKIVPLGVTETRGGLYEKNCWYCRPDSLIGVPGRPPVQEKARGGSKKRAAGAGPRPTVCACRLSAADVTDSDCFHSIMFVEKCP